MIYLKRKRYNSEYIYLVIILSSILCYILKISRWKLILFFEIVFAVIYFAKNQIKKKCRNHSLLKSRIYEIDRMDGVEFENLLKAHFEKVGYKVKTTPKSNDYGADLILLKDGMKIVVQAKRYKNSVGIAAIQQAYASMGYYKAQKCMVITNSYFTSSAKKLAEKNGVILWNRDTLIKKFKIKKAI